MPQSGMCNRLSLKEDWKRTMEAEIFRGHSDDKLVKTLACTSRGTHRSRMQTKPKPALLATSWPLTPRKRRNAVYKRSDSSHQESNNTRLFEVRRAP